MFTESELRTIAETGEALRKVAEFPYGQPRSKRRVISKMAKNIQPGDRVDFPVFGEQEVIGWSRKGGVVIVTAGQYMTSFDEDERVRIVREVAA